MNNSWWTYTCNKCQVAVISSMLSDLIYFSSETTYGKKFPINGQASTGFMNQQKCYRNIYWSFKRKEYVLT